MCVPRKRAEAVRHGARPDPHNGPRVTPTSSSDTSTLSLGGAKLSSLGAISLGSTTVPTDELG